MPEPVTPENSPAHTWRLHLIHGKYLVLEELLDFVRISLEGFEKYLTPGQTYLAKDLTGLEYWALLQDDEPRLVGSVIADLVNTGELPLVKLPKLRYWHSNTYMLVH